MVNEIQYTNIRRVLDNITDHPMLSDVSLEQAVRYTIRFIGLHGYNKLYQDRIENIDIEDFRGVLPCDLIRIVQVKDLKTGVCLRAMTDNFPQGQAPHPSRRDVPSRDLTNNIRPMREMYIPALVRYAEEPAFKTQGRIIYTSFPEGCVQIAYKAVPVDEDGYPLLIDNETYLAALEAYIKKQIFTIKFDTGKINSNVLVNAQNDYAFLAKQLQSEMVYPSTSEMEAISRSLTALVPRMRDFDDGFKGLGDREYLHRHNNVK